MHLPRVLLRVEGAVALLASVWAYSLVGPGWGWFALLLFVPDVCMLGYLAGPRVGSVLYNAVHTYLAPGLVAAGMATGVVSPTWWVPLIWTAHIGVDRLLGYGLKYPTGFKDTHLQRT